MFAISPTDIDWFEFLKQNGIHSNVNFWTPTPWNIKGLKPGDRLYFMLKSPIRKIGGFGQFVEYKNLTAAQAWNAFGFGNGRNTRQELVDDIQEYINKNSKNFGGQPIDVNTYEIGCIVLKNCEYWDTVAYIDPSTQNINFARQIVKLKYFDQSNPFAQINKPTSDFIPAKTNTINQFPGAAEKNIFNGIISRAYENRCCITGESLPDLLEVAYIQGYRYNQSNHVQNGLLMRVDFSRLFLNNLLFLDVNYVIHISSLVTNPEYRQYHGQSIRLPVAVNERPSRAALEMRSGEYRILN